VADCADEGQRWGWQGAGKESKINQGEIVKVIATVTCGFQAIITASRGDEVGIAISNTEHAVAPVPYPDQDLAWALETATNEAKRGAMKRCQAEIALTWGDCPLKMQNGRSISDYIGAMCMALSVSTTVIGE
jgi:hypothetical protein